jgi:hypothetical protein
MTQQQHPATFFHLDVLQCQVLCRGPAVRPEPGRLAGHGGKQSRQRQHHRIDVDVQVIRPHLGGQEGGPGVLPQPFQARCQW